MKRTELVEKRTANRKVFENQDHSRTVEIYMEPVHYQDKDGDWKEAAISEGYSCLYQMKGIHPELKSNAVSLGEPGQSGILFH